VLAIKTTQRCYVVVRSLATRTDLFASTIGAGTTQSVLVPSGSTTLEAFAAGSSLSVNVQGKPVGTVAVLRFAVTYSFNPTGP
jgi:hypothetical protein